MRLLQCEYEYLSKKCMANIADFENYLKILTNNWIKMTKQFAKLTKQNDKLFPHNLAKPKILHICGTDINYHK